jgi:hypothetical protein
LKRGVKIKILTDNLESELLSQINEINQAHEDNQIQIGYTNKLGNIDEFMMVSDGKHLLEIKYDSPHSPVATYSNKEHQIQVQEILFEKQWNEIKSLVTLSSN